MKEVLQEGLENFQEGGGFRTIARRFAQAVPFWVMGPGAVGFIAGEILPGLPDFLNAPVTANALPSIEYGPQWAVTGAEIGLGAAVIDAVARPFFVGAAIRRGELYDIPEMPNIVDYAVRQTRRMVARVRGRRQDVQQDLSSISPPFLPPHEE